MQGGPGGARSLLSRENTACRGRTRAQEGHLRVQATSRPARSHTRHAAVQNLPLPSRQAECHIAEGDLVARTDHDRTVDAPTVEAGSVRRPEIDEEPLLVLVV